MARPTHRHRPGRSGNPAKAAVDRAAEARTARRRFRRRLVLGLVLGAVIFTLLRTVHALADPPDPSDIYTTDVVVVGVTARATPTAGDRALLDQRAGDAQYGAVAIRPRYVGDCAAAGWTTLGAGRRAAVAASPSPTAPLCTAPTVADGTVSDWTQRVAAARLNNGDAALGTLAGSGSGCVAAVGPYAALAAAKPDGTVASYRTLAAYEAAGYATTCPVTLVDPGTTDTDALMAALAKRPDTTAILTGVGPAAGSDDPALQLVYRLTTTFPGALTSDSTRREGVVTLNDLTASLVAVVQAGDATKLPVAIDGGVLQVDGGAVSGAAAADNLAAVTALSDAMPVAFVAFGVTGLLVVLALALAVRAGRRPLARRIGALCAGMSAAMMLTGALPWQETSRPALWLMVLLWAWGGVLFGLSLLLSRWSRIPLPVAAAALTALAYTTDAALGTVMQPGSMINSRPIFALRWYGFGNVTFAAYASAVLLVIGYLAGRLVHRGRRRPAVIVVLGIGLFVIACQGWPTMGTDFGGVVALTPIVLWLALVVSGARVTWPKVLGLGAAAVLAVGTVSVLDWLRPAAQRSHLGNFVQRVVDGDATDVVIRKAVASAETIASPMGVISILVGGALWVVIFRFGLPAVRATVPLIRTVAVAILATAVLGTLVNDGGISVWMMFTACFTVSVGALWLDSHARAVSR